MVLKFQHGVLKVRAAGKAAQVIRLLEQKERELRLENQRKSLPQVASGLRCWHAFGTALLDYDERRCRQTVQRTSACG